MPEGWAEVRREPVHFRSGDRDPLAIQEHALELRHRWALEPHEANPPAVGVEAAVDVGALGAHDAVRGTPDEPHRNELLDGTAADPQDDIHDEPVRPLARDVQDQGARLGARNLAERGVGVDQWQSEARRLVQQRPQLLGFERRRSIDRSVE